MYLLCLDILFNFVSSKCFKFSFEFHKIESVQLFISLFLYDYFEQTK